MKQLLSESELEQQARTLLRHSDHNLDQSIEAQLAEVRHTALTRDTHKYRLFSWPGFAVATATVVVSAILLMPLFNGGPAVNGTEQIATLDDAIERELEFYQWLLETGAIAIDSYNG